MKRPTKDRRLAGRRYVVRDAHHEYGWEWGPLTVVRLAHIAGLGWWLAVETEHATIVIRASAKGHRLTIEEAP